jgi:hypothetical protein
LTLEAGIASNDSRKSQSILANYYSDKLRPGSNLSLNNHWEDHAPETGKEEYNIPGGKPSSPQNQTTHKIAETNSGLTLERKFHLAKRRATGSGGNKTRSNVLIHHPNSSEPMTMSHFTPSAPKLIESMPEIIKTPNPPVQAAEIQIDKSQKISPAKLPKSVFFPSNLNNSPEKITSQVESIQ